MVATGTPAAREQKITRDLTPEQAALCSIQQDGTLTLNLSGERYKNELLATGLADGPQANCHTYRPFFAWGQIDQVFELIAKGTAIVAEKQRLKDEVDRQKVDAAIQGSERAALETDRFPLRRADFL